MYAAKPPEQSKGFTKGLGGNIGCKRTKALHGIKMFLLWGGLRDPERASRASTFQLGVFMPSISLSRNVKW